MTLFDRYLLFQFARVFAVCFIALQGLLIVGHLFTNLDEMIEIARLKSLQHVVTEFYWPRCCLFFDQLFGLLTLSSALFAFVLLQRTHQTTAVEAGGISKARIVRPLLIATLVLISASVLNRELLLPKYRSSLARTAQNWMGDTEMPVGLCRDPNSGLVIGGNRLKLASKEIQRPVFQMKLADQWQRLVGESAVYLPADTQHPAGYLVSGVQQPELEPVPQTHSASHPITMPEQRQETDLVGSANLQPMLVSHRRDLLPSTPSSPSPLLTAADNRWLEPDQVFVPTQLTIDELAYGREMKRYSSLAQLLRSSRNPSLSINNRQRVEFHSRFVRPLLDLGIVILGLSLVISRREPNLFVAGGLCAAIVLAVQLSTLACNALGAIRMIQQPDFAAWIPVLVFVPLSWVAFCRLK